MEERKLTEKESLELITRMIQNTRCNLDAGNGNLFLAWGYVGAILTLIVVGGLYFTKNPMWMWAFWAIPLIGIPVGIYLDSKVQKLPKSYTDKVLAEIWRMLGCLTMALVIGTTFMQQFEFILPLCALLVSIGSILTGIIVRCKAFYLYSMIGLAIALYMLLSAMGDESPTYISLLCFVVVSVFAMIIPGHMLNHAAKKENMHYKEQEGK